MLIIESDLRLVGDWLFTAYDGTIEEDDLGVVLNPVVWQQAKRNLITTVGKNLSLDRLFGLGGAVALTGTSVGTSATAATVGDTTLTAPVFKVFDALPTRTGQIVTANTTYGTTEANINIQEAGLLTASGGVLFNRLAPIGPFTKSTAVSLRIQTQITQA